MRIVISIQMKHNLEDKAFYSIENQDVAVSKFFISKSPEKKMGVSTDGSEEVYLIRQREKEDFPEVLPLCQKQYEKLGFFEVIDYEQGMV